MSLSRVLAAILLPSLTAPALAAGVITLVDRSATLAVQAYAGTGTADANLPCDNLPFPDPLELCSVSGSLGSPDTALHGTAPGRLEIAGEATAQAADGSWGATMTLAWSTWQEHALTQAGTDAVLSAAGGHSSTLSSAVSGPGAVQPGTRTVSVWNLQRLDFRLDQATAYTLSGSNFGEYQPLGLFRDDGTGQFVSVALPGITALSPFSFGGVLMAGLYRIQNYDAVQADFQDSYAYGWDYALTLHDTVAAVPEPGSMAMLAMGLAVVGVWRRRRVTSD
jgi:hypothetical protein